MNKETASILLIVIILLALFGLGMYYLLRQTPQTPADNTSGYNILAPVDKAKDVVAKANDNQKQNLTKNMQNLITIKTNLGEIQFETYNADAPKASQNFIDLANKKYYDGLIFHLVIKGFMIQGGDPLCGVSQDKGRCGTGGPGYQFEDELNPATESYKNGYKKGVVAMANSGPNTNGSQFFIMTGDTPLPNAYTIFGQVVKGQDVVDKIANVKTAPGDRPVDAVVMQSVTVSEI
jgi:cyclophilin family peptidyl-prolyl cis-trans isomerase